MPCTVYRLRGAARMPYTAYRLQRGSVAIERFEQLDVWQVAHSLVLGVYKSTLHLPADEKYGLVSQMRRASVSIPANIAEGFKRRGQQDKAHFYNMSEASLEELRYYFILCRDLGYKIEFDEMAKQADQISRMLHGLIKSVKG
jgi:four helix bundle protein